MYKCPHCGKKSIPLWKKLIMDPRYNYKCKECGGYINTPYYYLVLISVVTLIVLYLSKEVLYLKHNRSN
jgi:transposase-like protein